VSGNDRAQNLTETVTTDQKDGLPARFNGTTRAGPNTKE
jgi:hypothetical protein